MTITDLRLSQANQLLGASYRLYRNTKTNETTIRTVGYLLPAILHTHIQTVIPTTCFPSMQVTLQTPRRHTFGPEPGPAPAASGKLGTRLQPPPPAPIVEPAMVRGMYGTDAYVPNAYGQYMNRLGVMGSRYPNWDDLTDFMLAFQAESADASFVLSNVDMVPLLDTTRITSVTIQYASAIIYPTPLWYYGTRIDDLSLVRFLDHILADEDPLQTLSISYNYFLEPAVPQHVEDVVCHQFARLGARGTSVLVASGNDGVGNGACRDGEGNIKFVVEFPSSCTSRHIITPSKRRYTRRCASRSPAHVSQVPGSPASAALNTLSRKSRRVALEVAFHTTMSVPTTRIMQCSNSSMKITA